MKPDCFLGFGFRFGSGYFLRLGLSFALGLLNGLRLSLELFLQRSPRISQGFGARLGFCPNFRLDLQLLFRGCQSLGIRFRLFLRFRFGCRESFRGIGLHPGSFFRFRSQSLFELCSRFGFLSCLLVRLKPASGFGCGLRLG